MINQLKKDISDALSRHAINKNACNSIDDDETRLEAKEQCDRDLLKELDDIHHHHVRQMLDRD